MARYVRIILFFLHRPANAAAAAASSCLQAGLGTTLRCAGGWVRDKLMGRQSLDIDIALDNMLGREFAQKVNEHLAARVSFHFCGGTPRNALTDAFRFSPAGGAPPKKPCCIYNPLPPSPHPDQPIQQGEKTHTVAVIMSNPEQSKHLETARLKINDVWVDMVNLRSEEYAQHSRIPTMEVR